MGRRRIVVNMGYIDLVVDILWLTWGTLNVHRLGRRRIVVNKGYTLRRRKSNVAPVAGELSYHVVSWSIFLEGTL